MVKKRGLYFQAIAKAAEGRLDIEIVDSFLYEARKAANREDYTLAAQHYERVFHVWQILVDSTKSGSLAQYRELMMPVLIEYQNVLNQLGRAGKVIEVQTAIDNLKKLDSL